MSSLSLNIPASTSTVSVSIIDTTSHINYLPASHFFGPPIKGFDRFNASVYSFLITREDESGKRQLIFDLGIRKDWEKLVPTVVQNVKTWGCEIGIGKNVSEILMEGGVKLDQIEGIVWSHAHWDHIGDPSTFPSKVDLLVGPGIKDAYMPGFPAKDGVPVLETDFAGRKTREILFEDSNIEIGGFQAVDYFGDGSFYLLYAPGHALGHLNALARTSTSPDTFIFLGADSAHHGSELRPTQTLPLPTDQSFSFPNFQPNPCPCTLFQDIHPHKSTTEPYVSIAIWPNGKSIAMDIDQAKRTIEKVQAFDAADNVMVILAHDGALFDVLEYFPKSANAWKEKGWKEKGRWRFLKDFQGALEANKA